MDVSDTLLLFLFTNSAAENAIVIGLIIGLIIVNCVGYVVLRRYGHRRKPRHAYWLYGGTVGLLLIALYQPVSRTHQLVGIINDYPTYRYNTALLENLKAFDGPRVRTVINQYYTGALNDKYRQLLISIQALNIQRQHDNPELNALIQSPVITRYEMDRVLSLQPQSSKLALSQ